jgi:methyl-accepting chemotaxis protein
MSWSLIADGVVAVLLLATLFYVRRFSKKIEAIRSSRGEFEKLIADLTRSTDQAASHLHQFRSAAELAGKDLQARVERVQGMTAEFGRIGDDLKLLAERAENAANRLEAAIGRSRQIVSTSATVSAPTAPAPAAAAIALADDEDDRKVASLSALSGLR